MENSNQVLGTKFKTYTVMQNFRLKKIKCSTSFKRLGHVESKIGDLEEILQIKLSCKI